MKRCLLFNIKQLSTTKKKVSIHIKNSHSLTVLIPKITMLVIRTSIIKTDVTRDVHSKIDNAIKIRWSNLSIERNKLEKKTPVKKQHTSSKRRRTWKIKYHKKFTAKKSRRLSSPPTPTYFQIRHLKLRVKNDLFDTNIAHEDGDE